MHNYARLNNLIKQIAVGVIEDSKPSRPMYGIVKSESPLTIEIEQRLTLNQNQLILTRNVTDFKTEISFDNPDIKNVITSSSYPSDSTESPKSYQRFKEDVKNEITIYNGLKVGEEVILMRETGGQKFIVVDRVVSL